MENLFRHDAMPRRDLTHERTEQILDAFERCIVKHGLEGSSLEKIGEEAGMKRPILRHYIGNRDQLVEALGRRVVRRWNEHLDYLEMAPRGKAPTRELLQQLFGGSAGQNGAEILVAESLIAAAERHPAVHDLMRDYLDRFARVLSRRLALIHPAASAARRWQVAYGLISLLFNDSSLVTLRLPPKYHKAALACATVLIDSLAG
jgi:AcrR family transcriptional regulator